MIKLITDPITDIQWIVQDKGIVVEKEYNGTIPTTELLNACLWEQQDILKRFLKKMANLDGSIRPLKRDKITNLDFKSYSLLNRALMQSNCKFNKKTSELIEL